MITLNGNAIGRVIATDRAAEGQPSADEAVRSDIDLRSHQSLRSGVLRLNVNEARKPVRSVARSLRTAQHLDLLDVEKCRHHADSAEIDVVDNESDRGVRRSLVLLALTDTANLKIARTRGLTGPIQVRHEQHHILEMLHTRVCQRIGIEHGNAGRELRRCPLAPIGRDDDFFGDRLLCPRSEGEQQNRSDKQDSHGGSPP